MFSYLPAQPARAERGVRARTIALAVASALGATLVGLGAWVARWNLWPSGHRFGTGECRAYGDHIHVLERWVLWP